MDADQPGAHEARVDLPPLVGEEFDIYINGVLQVEGESYELDGRVLVFRRPLEPEVKMSRLQWVLVGIGIGSYRKHDSIDVVYEHEGRRLVATGLKAR